MHKVLILFMTIFFLLILTNISFAAKKQRKINKNPFVKKELKCDSEGLYVEITKTYVLATLWSEFKNELIFNDPHTNRAPEKYNIHVNGKLYWTPKMSKRKYKQRYKQACSIRSFQKIYYVPAIKNLPPGGKLISIINPKASSKINCPTVELSPLDVKEYKRYGKSLRMEKSNPSATIRMQKKYLGKGFYNFFPGKVTFAICYVVKTKTRLNYDLEIRPCKFTKDSKDKYKLPYFLGKTKKGENRYEIYNPCKGKYGNYKVYDFPLIAILSLDKKIDKNILKGIIVPKGKMSLSWKFTSRPRINSNGKCGFFYKNKISSKVYIPIENPINNSLIFKYPGNCLTDVSKNKISTKENTVSCALIFRKTYKTFSSRKYKKESVKICENSFILNSIGYKSVQKETKSKAFISIKAENGKSKPFNLVLKGESIRLKAVLNRNIPGSYTWKVLKGNGKVGIKENSTNKSIIEVKGKELSKEKNDIEIEVGFKPKNSSKIVRKNYKLTVIKLTKVYVCDKNNIWNRVPNKRQQNGCWHYLHIPVYKDDTAIIRIVLETIPKVKKLYPTFRYKLSPFFSGKGKEGYIEKYKFDIPIKVTNPQKKEFKLEIHINERKSRILSGIPQKNKKNAYNKNCTYNVQSDYSIESQKKSKHKYCMYSKIIVVNSEEYLYKKDCLKLIPYSLHKLFPFATTLLNYFLKAKKKGIIANKTENELIEYNRIGLTHSVGANFGNNGKANIKRYIWIDNHYITEKILDSPIFIDKVLKLIQKKDKEIKEKLDSATKNNIKKSNYKCGGDISSILGQHLISKKIPLYDDLLYSLHNVKIEIALDLEFKKELKNWNITDINMKLKINDLYDFDYEGGTLANIGAGVQIGFNSLYKRIFGEIYAVVINLNFSLKKVNYNLDRFNKMIFKNYKINKKNQNYIKFKK